MKQADYRLRIAKGGNLTFFTRTNGRTSYFSASETPLALSNLLLDQAATARFALQDAKNGNDAAKYLREILAHQWKNNPAQCPLVTLL